MKKEIYKDGKWVVVEVSEILTNKQIKELYGVKTIRPHINIIDSIDIGSFILGVNFKKELVLKNKGEDTFFQYRDEFTSKIDEWLKKYGTLYMRAKSEVCLMKYKNILGVKLGYPTTPILLRENVMVFGLKPRW